MPAVSRRAIVRSGPGIGDWGPVATSRYHQERRCQLPTSDERLDRIEGVAKRTAVNLGRLTQVVSAIAASVAGRDEQIGQLVKFSEDNARKWEQLRREWQAYLRTLRPQ